MRQAWLVSAVCGVAFVGCMVDGSAPTPTSFDNSTGVAGSGTPQAGSGTTSGMGGTASTGTAGTPPSGTAGSGAPIAGSATTTGGTPGTAGSAATTGGTGNSTGGTNVVAEGGTGTTETNPGKGNGFFPASILPSHAKTAYTTWKGKYLKMCSASRYRVAS
ncbi:MAG TPA: hypothetical protein VEQ58_15815, partial [Polyangiaceae bacterium]|nr:hypothetical protein [Polyangiaceae bacterium]